MEQIEQLKAMRDEAMGRLQLNPDYKLATSLDALIDDLEAFVAPKVDGPQPEPQEGDEGEEAEGDDEDPLDAAPDEDGDLRQEFDGEDSRLADAISESINGDDLAEETANSDEDLTGSFETDSEASAAIEALEAELAQATSGEDK